MSDNFVPNRLRQTLTGESFAPENPSTQRLAQPTDRRPEPS